MIELLLTALVVGFLTGVVSSITYNIAWRVVFV
jgi:hypothetical protein